MRWGWSWALAVAVVFVGLSGCELLSRCCGKAKGTEEAVALSDVPGPARAAIEELTAGGEIKKIDREMKGGTAIYDVEARVGGVDVEYDVDAGGNVLSSERSVDYASLPAVVRAAAENYFGSLEGLEASREIESGRTFYEVAGQKDGAKRELKLTEDGKVVEDEEGD
jgi:uncharacterized membrane protein YkoI